MHCFRKLFNFELEYIKLTSDIAMAAGMSSPGSKHTRKAHCSLRFALFQGECFNTASVHQPGPGGIRRCKHYIIITDGDSNS